MVKKSKLMYFIGFAIISICIVLVTFFALIAGGVIDTRSKLVFSSGSLEKTYDEQPLVCNEWEQVGGKLKKGHKAVVTVTASLTEAGSVLNKFTVKILDSNNKDISDNYNIESKPGTLQVKPIELTMSTGSESKEYDGTKLTCDIGELVSGKLLDFHELTLKPLTEITDAGTIDNNILVSITDKNDKDVTKNYNITMLFGKLTIEKRKISVSTSSSIKVYDGTALTCDEWALVSETTILESQEIQVVVKGTQTDVGTSKNSVAEIRITEKDGGKNATDNYEIKYIEGELYITPRTIAIRSESDSKPYDGKPLTNNYSYCVSNTKVAENQKATVTVTGTRTEVGESNNTIAEVVIITADGKNVASNYDIKLQEGSLVVKGETTPPTEPTDPPEPPDPSKPPDSNLDESGDIGGGGTDADAKQITARVLSQTSDRIYLRYLSYGNYTGSKWETATKYNQLIDSKYSLNYLTGIALKNAGYTSSSASIEVYGQNYLLPSNLDTAALNYEIQTSDVKNSGSTASIYSAYFYQFNYEESGLNATLPEEYQALEKNYYEFVKTNYLSIPSTSTTFFQELIAKENFNASDPNIISAVAKYIRSAATYNLKYDVNLDKSQDIAVSFLRDYKEGICQHYATAATALYRALGIPARYVIGYVGDTQSNKWVDIPASNAHAWVEVYLSGIGWVQVEVTGGGPGMGESGGGNGEPGEQDGIEIKPIDLYKQYVYGAVLEAGNTIQGINSLLEKGYTYTATVSGKCSTIGVSESVIEKFNLFNSDGVDVTEQFKFKYKNGKLQMYVRELTITTESLEKIYDGEELRSENSDFDFVGELLSGHKFEKKNILGAQIDVGKCENSRSIKIVNELNEDITYMYKINRNFGSLTVFARELVITAGSSSKSWDGIALTNDTYIITSKNPVALAPKHKIEVVTSGSQTNRGRSPNQIESVIITNEKGIDVTQNYSMKFVDGLLEVT